MQAKRSLDLPGKYRPTTFEQVLGQPNAVRDLARLARKGDGVRVILFGPSGTGKTTLARILSQALFCENVTDSGSPCHSCSFCRSFKDQRLGREYMQVNAAEYGRVPGVSALMELAQSGQRFVLVLDEAHNLTSKAAQLLLDVVETRLPGVSFILCTTDLERIEDLSEGMLPRFQNKIAVLPVAHGELIAAGRRICSDEGIEADEAALEELAFASDGSLRTLVQHLGELAPDGPITLQRVRSIAHLIPLWVAGEMLWHLAHGDLSSADQVSAGTPPGRIRKATEILVAEALRWSMSGSAILWRGGRDLSFLAQAVKVGAEDAGRRPASSWAELVEAWARRSRPMSVAQMRVAMLKTVELLAAPRPSLPSKVRPARKWTRSARTTVPAAADKNYLDKRTVREFWDCAAFLGVVYDATFNLTITSFYPDEVEGQSATIARDLAHAMRERVRANHPGELERLFWLCLHSRNMDGMAQSIWAISAPTNVAATLEVWLPKYLADTTATSSAPQSSWRRSRDRQVSFQADLVRRLSAGLDPTIMDIDNQGNRGRLVDLLGVELRAQSAVGVAFTYARYSRSNNLAPRNRKRQSDSDAVPSPFRDRAWEWLGAGWERAEYQRRQTARLLSPQHLPSDLGRYWAKNVIKPDS